MQINLSNADMEFEPELLGARILLKGLTIDRVELFGGDSISIEFNNGNVWSMFIDEAEQLRDALIKALKEQDVS